MFELITTPKTAIIFAVIASIVIDLFLTGFLTFNGIGFIGALVFCTPLSIAIVLGLMVVGGIVFHVHKRVTN